MLGKADAFRAGAHIDPLAFQNLADRLRDILVFTGDKPRVHLDDRHFGAEPPVHLCEFEPDIAAADDDEMLRHPVECQDRGIGEV